MQFWANLQGVVVRRSELLGPFDADAHFPLDQKFKETKREQLESSKFLSEVYPCP